MKRIFLLLIISYAAYLYTRDESAVPPLRDADIIFQTSWTDQSIAIGLATASLYIHTGLIKHSENGDVVIEAGSTVRETPLHDWIGHGILKRFAVYRYRDLTPEQADRVVQAAKTYYGRPYDHYFYFGNNAIYCSELVYLAFKDAGLPELPVETIGTLYINNPFTKKLIEQRWQRYPACQGQAMTFGDCYDTIMTGKLISPSAIAHDAHMEKIFSNYP